MDKHSFWTVAVPPPVVSQVLKLELKEIREQQDLLFRFMNFLKQEGAVHVLQFLLTVGKDKSHRTSYEAVRSFLHTALLRGIYIISSKIHLM